MKKFLPILFLMFALLNLNDTVETLSAAQEKNVPIWADIQAANEGADRWEKAINLGIKSLQTDHPKALIDFLKMRNIR